MARSRTELDPRFRRLMNRLPPELTEELKEEIARSGQIVYENAQARVPIDTGALRDSIGLRIGSNGLSVEIGFDSKKFRAKWNRAGWRAKFIELGTKGYQPERKEAKFRVTTSVAGERKTVLREANIYHRNGARRIAKSLKPIPPRPARPFLRPAFETNRAGILERHRKLVILVLEKAAKL